MRLLQITVLCLGLTLWLCVCCCPVYGQTTGTRLQRREASAAPEPTPEAQPEALTDAQPEPKVAAMSAPDVEEVNSGEKATAASKQPLGIASIKSRAIDMNKGLCQEQSRYHPHFPKCHDYCKKLDHWVGQCWRMICHCYS